MNNNESDRLTRLETQMSDLRLEVGDIRSDVKKVMSNHLPHIKQDILKLELSLSKKIDKNRRDIAVALAKGGVIITIVLAVINFLVNKFLL